MKCDEAELWIAVRVDGEVVPGPVSQRLDGHLEACPACRALVEAESRRAGLLGEALATDASEGPRLAAAVVRAAAEALPMNRAEYRRLRVVPAPLRAAALAACVALGVAGFWIFSTPESAPLPRRDVAGDEAPPGPWTFLVEETQEEEGLVPGPDGSPLRRQVERVRRISVPVVAPVRDDSSGAGSRPPAPSAVGVEEVKTRYIHLTSWPYQ
ncbi:MAG: zf-HC2 domain-containing protein [Planctomycetes bacterium]|nr:zf-HC2 domain-containing protein [Planctomycetota bacterium]